MTENEVKTNDSNEEQEQLLYAKWIFGICLALFIVSMGILISNHLSYLCLEKSLVETVKDIGAAIKSKQDVEFPPRKFWVFLVISKIYLVFKHQN